MSKRGRYKESGNDLPVSPLPAEAVVDDDLPLNDDDFENAVARISYDQASEVIDAPMALVNSAQPYTCSICTKSFHCFPRLWMHAKTHRGQPWSHAITNPLFRIPSNLPCFCPVEGCLRSRHGSFHNKDLDNKMNKKPFAKGLAQCRAHFLRQHSKEKPFVCHTCRLPSKAFRAATRAGLVQHQRHCGTEIKIWRCGDPQCRTHCKSKTALKVHCKRRGCPLPDPLEGVPLTTFEIESGQGGDGRPRKKIVVASSGTKYCDVTSLMNVPGNGTGVE